MSTIARLSQADMVITDRRLDPDGAGGPARRGCGELILAGPDEPTAVPAGVASGAPRPWAPDDGDCRRARTAATTR